MADCTFGGGNHSIPLIKKYENLRILGMDLDSKVLNKCKEEYTDHIKSKKLALEHINYVNITAIDPK
jgi:16S rRNA C1402 N4-methylase RsmH